MKKWLARLIWFPLGLMLVVFLVANRAPVAVSLDPISTEHPAIATPPLPLWVWLIFSLLVGFFIGIGGMWVSAREARIVARANARELRSLKQQVAAKPAAETAPPEATPGPTPPAIEAR